MKKCFSLAFLLILFCSSSQYAMESSTELKRRIYRSIGIVAATCGMAYGALAAHEMGHAITAKMLWGNPIAVTFGSYTYYGSGIHFDANLSGLIGIMGCAFIESGSARPKFEQLLVSGAGPICGSLSSIGMYYLLKKVFPKDFFGTKQEKSSFLKNITACSCYAQLSNLIPVYLSENCVSDGANIAIAYNLIDRKSIKPITWYLKQALDGAAAGLICWKLK